MRTTTPSRKRAILPPAVQRRLDAIQHFLPHLTLPQQRTLALWCFGIQRARSHSLTLVSLLLAPLCKCHANAMRKRLKTWYAQTRNAKRRLNVHSCFAGLLRWMTTDWSAPNLLLALDTTTLRNRWIILTVSVLYKKRAIPVAWRVLAWDKQAWNPIWKQLLSALAPAFPPRVRVLVFADRGLYSPELFEYIRQLGAHPAMRVNGDGGVLVEGSTEWQMLQELVPSPDTHWNGRCRVFKTNSLDCTVLALWAVGMREAWIVLTDLPPCEASAVWYRYRSWIEQGYRDLKRLGGVVSSDAGSGCRAFRACVVSVGGGDFVGAVVRDGRGVGASCVGCAVVAEALCGECVSSGLVVGVVGDVGVCGGVVLRLVS